jgi:hypothetical protein
LLDSVDNLERAIQAAGDEESPLLEGVKLTLKSLTHALEKFEVQAVDTANGFNADLHQAVGIDPNAKAGEIGNVLQKGYTFLVVYCALQWSQLVNKPTIWRVFQFFHKNCLKKMDSLSYRITSINNCKKFLRNT